VRQFLHIHDMNLCDRFGSGFMGESTGIIYNNHMADFTLGNSSDIYGLPQNENNRIEPGIICLCALLC